MSSCVSATQTHPWTPFPFVNYIIAMPPGYPIGSLHLMYPKSKHVLSFPTTTLNQSTLFSVLFVLEPPVQGWIVSPKRYVGSPDP